MVIAIITTIVNGCIIVIINVINICNITTVIYYSVSKRPCGAGVRSRERQLMLRTQEEATTQFVCVLFVYDSS